MARKRAPGGGRKPKGAGAARLVAVRMPEEMYAALIASARKRNWTLTDELLWRVTASFREEQRDRRYPSTRALGYLISEIADRLSLDAHWHRDVFTFRAFKRAVAELLNAIEPKGELRKPEIPEYLADFADFCKTPDSAARYTVRAVLFDLFNTEAPDDFEAFVKKRPWFTPGGKQALEFVENLTANMRRRFYAMSDVRRDLEIEERKSSTKGSKQ